MAVTQTQLVTRLLRPDGQPAAGVHIRVVLTGGTDPGWLANHTADIASPVTVLSDNSGNVSVTLTPQSELAASGTYYLLTGFNIRWALVVPVSGSPVQIRDCLVDPTTLDPVPAALPSYYLQRSERGTVNGVASLDSSGKVPAAQLPLSGGGAVDSVNGHTGTVVLGYADVGADASGAATSAVSGHVSASDPHGDRAFATSGLAGKANTTHTHAETDVTGLVADLAAKVASVTAADSTITVGGTGSAPTVGVNAIPESKVTGLVADLGAKATDSAVVHNTGAETLAGVKTFTSAPVVPAGAFPESAVSGLVADLAAKAPLASPTFTGTVTVPAPSNATDAATKAYVDATAAGLSVKTSATAAAGSNVTSLSGAQTVDGVSLTAGNRVLLTAQATGSQNGLWVVAAGAWTRPTDYAAGATVPPGAFVFVEGGTVNASSGWVLQGTTTVVVDTTSTGWTQFSGAGEIVAGTGLSKTGNTLANTGVLAVTAADSTITVGGTGANPTVAVNAISESKVTNLVTDLAGKVPTSRQITAGTGLSGGGDLTADRSLAVSYGSASGTAVQGNDTRVTADQAAGTASIRTLGTGSVQAAAGNHTHADVPTTRQVIAGTGLTGGGALSSDVTLAVSYGTGSGTAAQGNDSRIIGAEQLLTPTAVKTGTYTAGANEFVLVDASAGGFTVTFPTTPADKTRVAVKGVTAPGSNVVTVACGGSAHFSTATGGTSATLTLQGQSLIAQYQSSTDLWFVLANDFPLSQADARYLRVANNLSDVTAATARTNLGLGGAAILNVGTTSGTVAAGNDSRILAAVLGQYPRSGSYVAPATTVSTASPSSGQLRATPIDLAGSGTADRIGVEVTVGVASAVCHLAIFNHDSTTGFPGSVLLSPGTVDVSTTGFKEITISQGLTAGRWWLAGMTISGGAPQYRGNATSPTLLPSLTQAGTSAVVLAAQMVGQTSVPSTFVADSTNITSPRVYLRFA